MWSLYPKIDQFIVEKEMRNASEAANAVMNEMDPALFERKMREPLYKRLHKRATVTLKKLLKQGTITEIVKKSGRGRAKRSGEDLLTLEQQMQQDLAGSVYQHLTQEQQLMF